MSIADTLLLLNDDPSKPLNRHFDKSLTDLREWISNSIRYIATDTTMDILSSTEPVTINHDGVVRLILTGSRLSSGTAITKKVYKNGSAVASVTIREVNKTHTSSTDVAVKKGDVLTVDNSSTQPIINFTAKLCGAPVLLDY